MTEALPNSALLWPVLRISEVRMTKVALETELKTELFRYEPARSGDGHYAQIDIPDRKDIWVSVIDCVQGFGEALISLRQRGQIGAMSIDVGVPFRDDAAMKSVIVPSEVALVLGKYGVDIEISIYRTSLDN
jgi:hypothetical protein